MKSKKGDIVRSGGPGYEVVLTDVILLIQAGRSTAARSANAVMTAAYWSIGHRIVDHEQADAHRAAYGEELLKQLAVSS
jgi:hypothetical protein